MHTPQHDSLTGKMLLRLRHQQGRVEAVSLQTQRLRLDSRFLFHRRVEHAPPLIGLLFSLCGTAQTVAAARACAAALGQTPDAHTERQREVQVYQEALFEHILRLTQEWNQALACEPLAAHDLQALFQLKRELRQTSDPHPTLTSLAHWIATTYLGLPVAVWLTACASGDVDKLCAAGHLGRLITRIRAKHWESLGTQPLHPLPPALSFAWWQARLTAPDAATFLALPTVDGLACETSALTRQWANPKLQVWRAAYGSGLLTRLLARVLDMLNCWQLLRTPPSPDWMPDTGWALGAGGEGIATVQTARGLLTHRVVQQAGLIQHYQVVAPTEWNFHPQGTLAQMLRHLHATDAAELSAQARTLITALDPCVAYHLELEADA